MPEEGQKQYELTCILSPQLEGADLENVKKEIEEIITKADGSIDFKEEKKHNLAYPINKQGQGIYLIIQVAVAPENVANLSKELKLNKQVLRHLITQISIPKPKVEKPKPKRAVAEAKVGKKIIKKVEKKEPQKEKVKLEEIDKKLNEIIEEI